MSRLSLLSGPGGLCFCPHDSNHLGNNVYIPELLTQHRKLGGNILSYITSIASWLGWERKWEYWNTAKVTVLMVLMTSVYLSNPELEKKKKNLPRFCYSSHEMGILKVKKEWTLSGGLERWLGIFPAIQTVQKSQCRENFLTLMQCQEFSVMLVPYWPCYICAPLRTGAFSRNAEPNIQFICSRSSCTPSLQLENYWSWED